MERNEFFLSRVKNLPRKRSYLRFLNPYIPVFKKNNFIPRNRDIYRPIIVPSLIDIKRSLFRDPTLAKETSQARIQRDFSNGCT